MTFSEFVAAFLRLGPKLPKIWKRCLAIKAEIEGLYEDLGTVPAQPLIDDAVDPAKEAELVAALSSDGALFDGAIIKKAYAFFVAHPELATMLFKLLAGAK